MKLDEVRLGVNIDHVATVRNARGTNYPDPLKAAKIVKEAGGRVTDFKGRNNYLDSGEIVASNFVIHDKLLSEI